VHELDGDQAVHRHPDEVGVGRRVGGPLICASGAAVLFGSLDEGGLGQGVATIPEILWELSPGIYLTAKGFKPSAVDALMRQPGPEPARMGEESSESEREAFPSPQPALVT
jgi:hypothetical protein